MTAGKKKKLLELYKKYDSVSAYDFILEQVGDEWLAGVIGWEADCLAGGKATEYSVFNLIGYESHLANLRYCMGRDEDDLDGFRVSQGVETLVHNWVKQIQEAFDRHGTGKKTSDVIRLNSPVASISNGGHPVVVTTKTGQQITCEKVFMCVPGATAKLISIDKLSEGKRVWVEEQNSGRITRMNVVFPTPF